MSIETLKKTFFTKNAVKTLNTDPLTKNAVGVGNGAFSLFEAIKTYSDAFPSAGGGGGGSQAVIMPDIFTASGNPVSPTSTVTFTLNAASANQVFMGPSTGSDIPSFRVLLPGDIPDISAAKIVAGNLSINRMPQIASNTVLANNTTGSTVPAAVLINTGKLFGRGTSNIGEVTLGTNLSMTTSGSTITLNAAGGGGGSTTTVVTLPNSSGATYPNVTEVEYEVLSGTPSLSITESLSGSVLTRTLVNSNSVSSSFRLKRFTTGVTVPSGQTYQVIYNFGDSLGSNHLAMIPVFTRWVISQPTVSTLPTAVATTQVDMDNTPSVRYYFTNTSAISSDYRLTSVNTPEGTSISTFIWR